MCWCDWVADTSPLDGGLLVLVWWVVYWGEEIPCRSGLGKCVFVCVASGHPQISAAAWQSFYLGTKEERRRNKRFLSAGGSEFVAAASNFCSLGSPGGCQVDLTMS